MTVASLSSSEVYFRFGNAPLRVLLVGLVLVTCCSAGVAVASEAVGNDSLSAKESAGFLKQFCADCHGDGAEEGERSFDDFSLPIQSVEDLVTADEIIDQITLKLMPPPDATQPSDDQRIRILRTLRSGIANARETFQSTGGRTVMRRLSNREYENTLATLFNRRVDTLGLTANFPKDGTSKHIDTIGDTLVTSGFLLDEYFQAASRLVDLRLGKPKTPEQTWHFTDNFQQYEELAGSHRSVFNNEFLCLYEQPNTDTRQGGSRLWTLRNSVSRASHASRYTL
ncbi:MAG: DUF1587 domain-containing protein [Rubripirellula sp.]